MMKIAFNVPSIATSFLSVHTSIDILFHFFKKHIKLEQATNYKKMTYGISAFRWNIVVVRKLNVNVLDSDKAAQKQTEKNCRKF